MRLEKEPRFKVWRTSSDEKVRDSHAQANGQVRFSNEPFNIGDVLLREPRDPDGLPAETFNCRCTKEEFTLSELPKELLPQVMGRLTDRQKQFLDNSFRVADAADEENNNKPNFTFQELRDANRSVPKIGHDLGEGAAEFGLEAAATLEAYIEGLEVADELITTGSEMSDDDRVLFALDFAGIVAMAKGRKQRILGDDKWSKMDVSQLNTELKNPQNSNKDKLRIKAILKAKGGRRSSGGDGSNRRRKQRKK